MKQVLTALGFLLVFVACNKDDDDKTTQTKTQLLTSGSWKYESGGVDVDRNGSVDITLESTGAVPPCLLDNIATFSADGSGVNDEGPTKCDNSLPQTAPFNWSFANNETAINLSGTGFAGVTGQFKISTLTTTNFTIAKDTTVLGLPASLIVNLKH